MKKEYDIENLNPRKNPYAKKLKNNGYKIRKVQLTSSIMKELIDLSKLWKEEAISIGITPNTKKDFIDKDIYVSYNSKNKIIGYLLCSNFIENKEKPTIPSNSKICFVDEIYVMKRYRSKGIGRMLFNKMSQDVKDRCDYIELVSSTKDYEKIINFYRNILHMNLWSIMFYKQIDK